MTMLLYCSSIVNMAKQLNVIKRLYVQNINLIKKIIGIPMCSSDNAYYEYCISYMRFMLLTLDLRSTDLTDARQYQNRINIYTIKTKRNEKLL